MAVQPAGILVVIDPFEDNGVVIQRAIELAVQLNAPVELFSCTYTPYFFGERTRESRSARMVKAHHIIERKSILDDIAKSFSKDHVKVRTDVYWDVPEYEAVERKVHRSHPIIVLRNSVYRSAIDRALMSHDDWNLIRNCSTPLLMVRGDADQQKTGIIWAAVDPMHENDKPATLDDEIIEQARVLADASDSELHLIHAYDSTVAMALAASDAIIGDMVPTEEICEEVRAKHEQRLFELANKHQIPKDRVHNIAGAPRIVLPSMAIQNSPDVVVMGAVSRGFFKRLIVGNTAERTLDKFPGDLCIVKPKGFVSPVDKKSPHEMQYREAQSDAQDVA